jgi:hypothetical protein
VVFEIRIHAALFAVSVIADHKSKRPKNKSFVFIYYLLFIIRNKKDLESGSFGLLVCGLMTSAICPQRYFDLEL